MLRVTPVDTIEILTEPDAGDAQQGTGAGRVDIEADGIGHPCVIERTIERNTVERCELVLGIDRVIDQGQNFIAADGDRGRTARRRDGEQITRLRLRARQN